MFILQVHQEFGELFAMKILIFSQELISVVLTPFVLWFSLPACAPAIIDFFREFSVHVDGRGYVCSFAEFNFERHGNVKFGAPSHAQDNKMVSNEGKMEKSFLNFKVRFLFHFFLVFEKVKFIIYRRYADYMS